MSGLELLQAQKDTFGQNESLVTRSLVAIYSDCQRFCPFQFLSRVSKLTRDIDIANLSARLSVRPLRSGIV